MLQFQGKLGMLWKQKLVPLHPWSASRKKDGGGGGVGGGGGDARAQANVSFYPAHVTLPPTLSFPISIKPMWIAFTSTPKRYPNLHNSS